MDEIIITILQGFVGYRSFCSCGGYQSKRYQTPGWASLSGKAHARKKHPKSTIVMKEAG